MDLEQREIKVHQRADRYNDIGKPKSLSGERTVPAPPMVINASRERKLVCPKRATGMKDEAGVNVFALELVFRMASGRSSS